MPWVSGIAVGSNDPIYPVAHQAGIGRVYVRNLLAAHSLDRITPDTVNCSYLHLIDFPCVKPERYATSVSPSKLTDFRVCM